MTRSENAIAAKARAMYAQTLTHAQYKELVHKQNVQEIASYLKNRTHFYAVLAELQESTAHRGLLETLLQRETFYQYARLVSYAQGRENLYHFVILHIEVDLILGCLREQFAPSGQDPLAAMPAMVRPYACFDIFELARAKTLDDMLRVLEKTPYAPILQSCRSRIPAGQELSGAYPVYEMALRRYYIETMLAMAEKTMRGRALAQMRELILIRADMHNLTALYRMKAYFKMERRQMGERLLPFYGKLSAKSVNQMAEAANLQELELLIRKSPYAKAFSSFNREEMSIESVAERILLARWKHLLRFATDPQVVYVSFMSLRGVELENITRIIEGVRYQLSPDRIESLLCR